MRKGLRPWTDEEDELIRDAAEQNRLHGFMNRKGYSHRMAGVALAIGRTLAAVHKRASRLRIYSDRGRQRTLPME